MIFAHWSIYARPAKGSSIYTWFGRLLRVSRLVFFIKPQRRIQAIAQVARYTATVAPHDPLHYLSNQHYFIKGLTLRERMEQFYAHNKFEEERFDEAYRNQIYAGQGITLWSATVEEQRFSIRLTLSKRNKPEGELTVTMLAGDDALHRTSFNWARLEPSDPDSAMGPFVSRNQGRWKKDSEPLDRFERAFPSNSPSFFCMAAVQGVAMALGSPGLLAVGALRQVCYEEERQQFFANSYDQMWTTLGGVHIAEHVYRVPVPFAHKPLSAVSAKHRARSARRREHWSRITEASAAALETHVRLSDTANLAALSELSELAGSAGAVPAGRTTATHTARAAYEPA